MPSTQHFDEHARCCNAQDYDVKNSADDWDALEKCCENAKDEGIVDSDCASLPPRPADRAPPPPADDGSESLDCNPDDYDWSDKDALEDNKAGWQDCCKASPKDPDCSKTPWA